MPLSFFQHDDVVKISRDLVGMYLFHVTSEGLTGGRIVETEAYNGRNDRACHAFHKRTPRTEVMYQSGGRAYVYLCYGIHHLFNIVTNKEGMADAVLIRALEPTEGLDLMRKRTGKKANDLRLASGPGLVGKAMGFDRHMTGMELNGKIWVTEGNEQVETVSARRIGVDYAGEHAELPWRFLLKDSRYVSRK